MSLEVSRVLLKHVLKSLKQVWKNIITHTFLSWLMKTFSNATPPLICIYATDKSYILPCAFVKIA